MHRLVLSGIALVVLAGNCIAADYDSGRPPYRNNYYDAGTFNNLADQIESEMRTGIEKAGYPSQVSQIVGQAQINFSRILMRRQDEIIRQNNEIIRQNDQILRLIRRPSKQ